MDLDACLANFDHKLVGGKVHHQHLQFAAAVGGENRVVVVLGVLATETKARESVSGVSDGCCWWRSDNIADIAAENLMLCMLARESSLEGLGKSNVDPNIT
jgi:hypothetical protein